LPHVGIEVLDPGFQWPFRRTAFALDSELLATAFFDGSLILIALGPGFFASRRVGFGIACLEVERGLFEAGKSVAIDALGGNPA
jgi:hypothetical protein